MPSSKPSSSVNRSSDATGSPRTNNNNSISPLTRYYLLAYNALSFTLWALCLSRGLAMVPILAPKGRLSAIFNNIYSPLLTTTQSLAALEILHSLVGVVRAPVMTTVMQVASRLLLVWGVMYPFHDRGNGKGGIVGGEGNGAQQQWGNLAFLGCLTAWGVTECIRYSFFAMQVWPGKVPGWLKSWLTWWRYNTFYVLYPIGISSECALIVLSLSRAAEVHPLYRWFLMIVLVIYVPGSYILYTHMIAQRRKVLRGKKRIE